MLAFEQALQTKAERTGLAKLTEAERTVLAIEALERKVTNGGYKQYFLNTPEHAATIVAALTRIECPVTAEISHTAVAKLGVAGEITPESISRVLEKDRDARLSAMLSEHCDGAYFNSGEPIADRLFAYLRAHIADVDLPGA